MTPKQLSGIGRIAAATWISIASLSRAESILLTPISAEPSTQPSSTNAADYYRQAMALLKENLSADDAGMLGLCGTDGCWVVTTPLGEGTTALLSKQQRAIALIRRGATMESARWDIVDSSGTIELANNGPRLAALLVLQARDELKAGHIERALADTLAAMAVARHLGQQPLFLCKVTQMAASRPGTEFLASVLLELPMDARKTLRARIEKLPPEATIAEAIRGEFIFGVEMLKRQNAGAIMLSYQGAMKPYYDALADHAELPPAEFGPLAEAELAKHSGNPFARIIAPSMVRFHENWSVEKARRALLLSAIDILTSDDDALARSRDPFGNGPFTRSDVEGGFILGSALTYKSGGQVKPVTLRIGPVSENPAGAAAMPAVGR